MGGSDVDPWLLAAFVAVWWIPVIFLARDLDEMPGLPRFFFWAPLPILGLPIIGPLLYWTVLRPRLQTIAATAAANRAKLNDDRRARGATTDEDSKRPRPSGGRRARRRR